MKPRSTSKNTRSEKGKEPSREALKAQLIHLRDHIISLARGESQEKKQVVWFDADFLASIASSRAQKWAVVKEILKKESKPFVTGVVSFGGTQISEIEFEFQLWVGHSPGTATSFHCEKVLAEVIRATRPYDRKLVLVTGNLEISMLAQRHGILVIHPEHAGHFVGLEFGA